MIPKGKAHQEFDGRCSTSGNYKSEIINLRVAREVKSARIDMRLKTRNNEENPFGELLLASRNSFPDI